MKVLRIFEVIVGFAIGIVSMFILVLGGIFAFGSIGKYLKAKTM